MNKSKSLLNTFQYFLNPQKFQNNCYSIQCNSGNRNCSLAECFANNFPTFVMLNSLSWSFQLCFNAKPIQKYLDNLNSFDPCVLSSLPFPSDFKLSGVRWIISHPIILRKYFFYNST